ncbi:hypothetical protein [Jeotgalibacillus proteolyticus]|uniref:Uncharacterized protein n=1 Tax=Jeotgalibacillus proteolyticus TaxID=2082395 RepID=A0A2S5GDJ5_9BACL|nr:hypothetical protein [Jeotgalibacillus proteolyticus]PPA71066.1 hypothetical protein C4B60_09835 [Jeotgalibacillus proteolyticus]
MDNNGYLILLGSLMVLIFGGTFTLRFFNTGELLIGQMVVLIVGIILLAASIIWRKSNKQINYGEN